MQGALCLVDATFLYARCVCSTCRHSISRWWFRRIWRRRCRLNQGRILRIPPDFSWTHYFSCKGAPLWQHVRVSHDQKHRKRPRQQHRYFHNIRLNNAPESRWFEILQNWWRLPRTTQSFMNDTKKYKKSRNFERDLLCIATDITFNY